MMNPELKAKWVAALRSGKYEQGYGLLNSRGKFCCLGVLCDVAGIGWENHLLDRATKIPVGNEGDKDCAVLLNLSLRKKFGLSKVTQNELWRANDGSIGKGMTFTQLADKIERSKRI